MKEKTLNYEELKKACSEKGLRLTKQRMEVLKSVKGSCSHPDVETIYKQVKEVINDISIDTVYRTLQTFEELNLIFRVDNQIPKARFDGDLRNHSHFICMKCGEIFDIFSDNEIETPKGSQEFGEIKHTNLQIKGICNCCKNRNKEGEKHGTKRI